jgi:hypothetical protein
VTRRIPKLRQLGAHLLLLIGREDVDDAVDRVCRADGVQRREHKMARLRRGHGDGDGLEVAQLTDEDDVRSWRRAARRARRN